MAQFENNQFLEDASILSQNMTSINYHNTLREYSILRDAITEDDDDDDDDDDHNSLSIIRCVVTY